MHPIVLAVAVNFVTEIPACGSGSEKIIRRRTVAIRRLKCRKCGTYHRELPYFLIPYKHYETELISGVLDEVVQADDMEGNLPCDSTVQNWHHWLMANELRIDGYLKSEGSRLPDFTGNF